METIVENKCPKCGGDGVIKTGSGGYTIYLKVECINCNFRGGRVALSDDLKEDYKKVNDRFREGAPCDVESFVTKVMK